MPQKMSAGSSPSIWTTIRLIRIGIVLFSIIAGKMGVELL